MVLHVAPHLADSEIPIGLADLASSYMEAAEQLSSLMKSQSWPPNFLRGQVLLWLTFHATELFLKACVLKANPPGLIKGHSLVKLAEEFKKHYPSLKLEIPFQDEPLPPTIIKEAFGSKIADKLIARNKKAERSAHERFRYPVDIEGIPWDGAHGFYPEMFFRDLEKLSASLKDVRRAVFEKDEMGSQSN